MGKKSVQIVGVVFSLVIAICTVHAVVAQSMPELTQYMLQVREGHATRLPGTWPPFRQPDALLTALIIYSSDSLPAVRSAANQIANSVGVQSKDAAVRQRCVAQLARAATDTQGANVAEVYSMLTHYQRSDFSTEAQQTLVNLFTSQPLYLDRLVRLAGFVGISTLQPAIKQLSGGQNKNNALRWAALLALARMGDDDAAQVVLRKVQRLPVEDDVVYDVFPDLIFTHHRLLIDYLVTVLQSDEAGCSPADPDQSEPILCAYRVMEMLAPVIENFPLKVGPSGDIQTRDYPLALQDARTWLDKHVDSYTINRDKY